MKRFQRMLVHLDLQGEHDAQALRYASLVSRLAGSKRVEFFHTGPVPLLIPDAWENSPARTREWLRQANLDLNRLVQRFFSGPAGCRLRTSVIGGAGFREILDRLRAGTTDLVVVGKGDANAAFVEKLVRKSTCSVLVVPAGRMGTRQGILVPTDFSEDARRALETAAAFARGRNRGRLDCFHAYEIPYGWHKTGMSKEAYCRELETWRLGRFEAWRGLPGLSGLSLNLVCQETVEVGCGILREAERLKAGLIVMGARGKDAMAEMLLGSTTAQVVRETRVPTLVVKPKGSGRALLDLLFAGTPG